MARTVGAVCRSGNTEIDLGKGIVRRDGAETYLRAKAQELLQYLVEHRDRPVSKEELLREIWGGVLVSDATIFGCVQEIRKALGDNARQPVFIRTLAKKGYWFVAAIEPLSGPEELSVAAEPFRPDLLGAPLSGSSAAADKVPTPTVEKPPAGTKRRIAAWLLFATATAGVLLLTLVSSPGARTQTIYEEVAWWKLDESTGKQIRDAAQGLVADIPPSGVTWVPGISGTALRFNGNDSFITGLDYGRLPRGSMARSLTAWIKVDNISGDETMIFGQGEMRPTIAPSLYLALWGTGQPGLGGLWIRPGPSPLLGPRVDDGKWHHLAGVFEGLPSRRATLYVDGLPKATAVRPEGIQPQDGGTRGWAMGRLPWSGSPFRGSIDDARIYKRPLTAAEIFTLYRCGGKTVDLTDSHGEPYMFAPVLGNSVEILEHGAGESSSRVRNAGFDFAGINFVQRRDGCSAQSLRAADVGQDIRISADLLIGGSPEVVGEGGPYFRSRMAAPGDGIIGGTSAGYWVQMQSDGRVNVRCLHPNTVVAFSGAIKDFDAAALHHLSVEAVRETVTVVLDGNRLVFDQDGKKVTGVTIPPLWQDAEPKGLNRGSAGIAFGCSLNRGKLGGQEARNIRVEKLPR